MPFGWLSGRHKVHRSIANEVATADFLERITQCGPIIRVVVAQKRFVQTALFNTPHRRDLRRLATDFFQRILLAVIHRCGERHGRGIERLHLIGSKLIAF